MNRIAVGYQPDEIDTASSTRSARLKWVVLVDPALPGGRAVNAAICVAAATSTAVPGLLGPAGADAEQQAHPGLPWAGCSILAATPEEMVEIRTKAAAAEDVHVSDMPLAAQETRVYDEYLEQLATAPLPDLKYLAVSIVGPRNRIDKWVKRLPLY